MVTQQPQRGILGKVAWKCIFIVTDMKGWGFCLGKANWHQLKDTVEISLGRVYTWQLLQGFFFVFILAFLAPPALFMFLLWWHNPTCPSRTAQQLTLLRVSAENTLSAVPSGLGLVPAEHPSLPLRDGRNGMIRVPCHEFTCCLLWAGGISVCLAVCFQGTVYF